MVIPPNRLFHDLFRQSPLLRFHLRYFQGGFLNRLRGIQLLLTFGSFALLVDCFLDKSPRHNYSRLIPVLSITNTARNIPDSLLYESICNHRRVLHRDRNFRRGGRLSRDT